MPHLEFTVGGPPVSHQTKERARWTAWKGVIRAEAAKHWGSSAPLTGKLKCTIINFHEGEDAALDDDNMVKPNRDALNGLIYDDDSQMARSFWKCASSAAWSGMSGCWAARERDRRGRRARS